MIKNIIILIGAILFVGCAGTGRKKPSDDSCRAYALSDEALEYNLQNQHEKALLLYDSAIILHPTDPILFTNRGLTKLELKDTIGAIADYYDALKLDSLDGTTLQNLGSVYTKKKEYQRGLYYTEKAAKIDQELSYIFYNMGYGRYMTDDYEGAIEAYQKHLQSKNNYSQDFVYYYIGYCHEKLGDVARAKKSWKIANEIAGYDFKSQLDSVLR